MPIITVKASAPAAPARITQLLAAVQEAGARALSCPSSNIWVEFEAVYHATAHPVVVLARAQAGRSDMQKEAFVRAVAAAVAHALLVTPEQVWVHYGELRPQDVWFGGRWAG
ncbi:MAG: hypothetical protein HY074_18420 [Deltaproteobacteria bacterium]|nr:hypothetical protein [Deltaproteobacteria bacterium]